MPSAYSEVKYRQGTKPDFDLIQPDENCIYFLVDTKQVYVGSSEYTKSAKTLSSRPSMEDVGEEGRLYVCEEDGSSFAYVGGRWVSVYDPLVDHVSSITAGEAIECDPNPIVNAGTVSHGVPEGAEETVPDTSEVKLSLGQSFALHEVQTDKFGHVVNVLDRTVTMPSADELSTVFKFKGTLETADELPAEGNAVGDVYYVVQESAEYVYLESGWERLGPVVDTSNFVQKVPGNAGKIAVFEEDGSIVPSQYSTSSGVAAGTYGSVQQREINVPSISVDELGRVVEAQNLRVSIADPHYVEDVVSWIFESALS